MQTEMHDAFITSSALRIMLVNGKDVSSILLQNLNFAHLLMYDLTESYKH